MASVCPSPDPEAPLVRALLGSTDCQVSELARSAYGVLFTPGGAFVSVLTALLTIYVALIGYRLLLGRAPLNVSDLALTVVKFAFVVALATQWATYQTVVYRAVFDGPQQVANHILQSLARQGAAYDADVFEGLQRAFDDLTAFSPAAPPGAAAPVQGQEPAASPTGGPSASAPAPNASSLLSKPGFDSLLLQGAAVLLLISTLGVLLVAKIVLALLLGLGPIFLAMLLFDATRGLFEGWVRASLAFAFAPLSTTLTLGLGLALLTPSLAAVEIMRDTETYRAGVAYSAFLLTAVLAFVSLGLIVAAGMVAAGFRLPRAQAATPRDIEFSGAQPLSSQPDQARVERIAAAVSRTGRDSAADRDAALSALSNDRRIASAAAADRVTGDTLAAEARLGQASRRQARPRVHRATGSHT